MLLPTFTFIAYEKCEELSHLFPIFSSKSMEYMIWIYYCCLYVCIRTFICKDIHKLHKQKIMPPFHQYFWWKIFTPSEKTKHEAQECILDSGHGMRPRLRWPILRQGREIPLGIWSFRSEHEWIIGEHRKQKWFNLTLKNVWEIIYDLPRRWKGARL